MVRVSSYLKSKVRAPILWIILPLIGGFILGREIGANKEFLLLGGVGLGGLWLWFWWKRVFPLWYWRLLGIASIVLLAWGYFIYRNPFVLNWAGKPEREVFLTIKITHPLPLKNHHGGYAKILDAPKHLEDLIGQRVYYCLCSGSPLFRSQIVKVRSLIAPMSLGNGNSFEDYLHSLGMSFKLYRGDVLETVDNPNAFFKFFDDQHQKFEQILEAGSSEKTMGTASIYKAMLLGNKASLTQDQKDIFRRTGSLHLFAISGLHVGVIAGCIALFFKLTRIPNPWAAILGLIILFLYVEITGAAPSAMRAFLMVAFYWGARAFYRKKSAFSALLASALVALLANPIVLWNIGFQLSYSVVAAILLYGLPLSEVIQERYHFNKVKKWILNLVIISLAAGLGGLPLSIVYFSTAAPGAILLSLGLIPVASFVMIGGFIALFFGLIHLPIISQITNPIASMGIQLMEIMISYSLKLPGLFWETSESSKLLSYITILLLFIYLYRGHIHSRLQELFFYAPPIVVMALLLIQ